MDQNATQLEKLLVIEAAFVKQVRVIDDLKRTVAELRRTQSNVDDLKLELGETRKKLTAAVGHEQQLMRKNSALEILLDQERRCNDELRRKLDVVVATAASAAQQQQQQQQASIVANGTSPAAVPPAVAATATAATSSGQHDGSAPIGSPPRYASPKTAPRLNAPPSQQQGQQGAIPPGSPRRTVSATIRHDVVGVATSSVGTSSTVNDVAPLAPAASAPAFGGANTHASNLDESFTQARSMAQLTRRGPPPPVRSRPLTVTTTPRATAATTAMSPSPVRPRDTSPPTRSGGERNPLSAFPTNVASQFNMAAIDASRIQQLEFVGTQTSPAYIASVDGAVLVHLSPSVIGGASASSHIRGWVPPSDSIICRTLTETLLFGQVWCVFLVNPTANVPVCTLVTYLHERMSSQRFFRLKQLLVLLLDVADAMAQLHRNGIAHGNLDCWNVFVKDPSSGREITALALSGYATRPPNRNPRYQAPEPSTDIATFEADVWAYGVLCWEIVTYCAVVPYGDVRSTGELRNALESGLRLSCPEQCPGHLFVRVIRPCFASAEARPTFPKIVQDLQALLAALD